MDHELQDYLAYDLSRCCSDEQLARFARNELSAMRTAWVDDHLAHCELCSARLTLFRADPVDGWQRLGQAWQRIVGIVVDLAGSTVAGVQGLEPAAAAASVTLRHEPAGQHPRGVAALPDGSRLFFEFNASQPATVLVRVWADAWSDAQFVIASDRGDGRLDSQAGEIIYRGMLDDRPLARLSREHDYQLKLLRPRANKECLTIRLTLRSARREG